MAYFPNGTSGACFEARWCCDCANEGDPENGNGCAIWDVHLLFNYEARDSEVSKGILDTLIADVGMENEDGTCPCRLFVEGKPEQRERRQRIERDVARYEAAMAECRQ